jgi:mRNA-degrading endonuclease RelE of RelBE toxin-antitoxin system
MKPSQIVLVLEAVQVIRSLPRRQQEIINDRLMYLGQYPHAGTDAIEIDDSGREICVNLHANYRIKYWIDPAEREIKVLRIQPRH